MEVTVRILALLLTLSACGTAAPPSAEPAPAEPAAATTPAAPSATLVSADPGIAPAPAAAAPNPALLKPSLATESAPDRYKVRLETTQGEALLEVHRDWAPLGADRFYNLVKIGFFDDVAFFRVIDGFMVQFGITGDPAVTDAWFTARIKDDPNKQSNTRGRITFATSGPDSRTTQVFVNYANNSMLDAQGFSPFGEVVKGMDVIDSLYKGYGEGAPRGTGPKQGLVQSRGNAYLKESFPRLDYLKHASIAE
jgi:peptidyl-prolyl cis-trans isomerase A (cyclophilin A)